MKKLAIFLLWAIAYSLVPEFTNNVIVHPSWHNYLNTVFVLNPIFISFGWIVSILLDKVRYRRAANIIYYLFFGTFGLMVEWFLLGNSPWASNAIQFAMFFYWAGLYTIPRIMTDPNPAVAVLKKRIIRFYIIYSVFHLAFTLILRRPDSNAFFVPLLWALVYSIINIWYIIPYIVRRPTIK